MKVKISLKQRPKYQYTKKRNNEFSFAQESLPFLAKIFMYFV